MPVKHDKQPFYISDSVEVAIGWAQNFAAKLPLVATKYNVPQNLQDQVALNATILNGAQNYIDVLTNWLNGWRTVLNELFNPNPGWNVPINYPVQPQVPALPPEGMAYILTPFIQVAKIILASPMLTQLDVDLLRLVPAQGKPVDPDRKPREKAESFNYPLLRGSLENGNVTIRIIRGYRWRGKSALLQVDRDGSGNFVFLAQTTTSSLTEPAVLPSGEAASAWCYRAVYVEGLQQVSDWSPTLLVGIMPQPQPFEASQAVSALHQAVNQPKALSMETKEQATATQSKEEAKPDA